MKKTNFGGVLIILGIFGMAGSMGKYDFWEECRAAADCIAGDPPDDLTQLALFGMSLIITMFGIKLINKK